MIQIFKKFFEFSGKQKSNFYRVLFISLIHAIFEAIRILAIAVVLDAIVKNNVNINTALLSLVLMLVSIGGCFITQNIMSMKQTVASYEVASNKRIDIGERLKYMPMGYFNDKSLGEITSAATSTTESFQEICAKVIQTCLQGTLGTLVIVLSILCFDLRIGTLMIIGTIIFLGCNALLQKSSKKLEPMLKVGDTKLVGAVLEYVQGISVVKSYNLDKDTNKAVNKAIKENEAVNYAMEKAFIPYVCLQNLVLKLFEILIIILSIILYIRGTMGLITCLLMIISSFFIYGQLEAAGNNSALLISVDKSIDIINNVFKTPVMDGNGDKFTPENYELKVENISFSYDEQTIINDISCVIHQGTTTAIIGPSGSGKTTLCHLMTRFWDVDKGKITLGKKDIKDYTLDSLMSNFSMVFQDVYLFKDTIANNIKFGKPSASRDEVIEAAKKAYCHDFICRLPKGYDTLLGEGGASISGGEKQRISIARALLKDAPIIILDEATANVDPENEQLLQESIEELTHNKTVIMIAHRLKTVQKADQILVIENGKIVQRGTHKELMGQGGLYSEFIGMRKQTIGWKLGKHSI